MWSFCQLGQSVAENEELDRHTKRYILMRQRRRRLRERGRGNGGGSGWRYSLWRSTAAPSGPARSHSAQQYGRHHTHQVQSLRLTDGTFPSFALLFRSHLLSFSSSSTHQNKTHIQAYKISYSKHISRHDYTISCTLWRKRWGRSNSWALSLFYIWGWRNN
jgi:hypothetical protein